MNDKQLAALIMSQVLPAMQAHPDLADVGLLRNYQPTQQGAYTTPKVYFFKVTDRRYGHPKRRETWNTLAGRFDHAEVQAYESTYQFSAQVPQDPAATTALTESDVLNVVSGIIQSDTILSTFQAAGVGILRVTDVRNPYIVDEYTRYEAIPTFDVVFTHERVIAATLPAVVAYEAQIVRV